MLEEQIDRNTADRQLLYDIRTEMRTNNTLLTQLLEVLRPIAKDTVPKVVKPKAKAKPKSKEVKPNGSIKRTKRTNNSNSRGNSAEYTDKRSTMPDK
jgi:hypothetical protein